MRTSDFDYTLPQELIAQTPLEPRDSSRMLMLNRGSGHTEHAQFSDLPAYLSAGDLLVVNDSRVIPARLQAHASAGGKNVELLLLRREGPLLWQAIGRPSRHLKPGSRFQVSGADVDLEVLELRDDTTRLVRLSTEEDMSRWGQVPLPPYIHQPLDDVERYQTVYAQEPGSAAAPTAGLHFTPRLLERLEEKGVNVASLTLHVGLDTFRPVHAEDPRAHKVHTEHFTVPEETATAVNLAKREGRKVVAVGTTAVRSLEQAALWSQRSGTDSLETVSGWADLLVLPGHQFRLVDALVTNFHLPRSTTLMLASAFAGWNRLKAAYEDAIQRSYRFYSFGDAMLIL